MLGQLLSSEPELDPAVAEVWGILVAALAAAGEPAESVESEET